MDSCHSLTLACPFISEQFVALLAAAFKGAHGVPAEVIAASVVLLAFVDVWVEKIKEWEQKGHQWMHKFVFLCVSVGKQGCHSALKYCLPSFHLILYHNSSLLERKLGQSLPHKHKDTHCPCTASTSLWFNVWISFSVLSSFYWLFQIRCSVSSWCTGMVHLVLCLFKAAWISLWRFSLGSHILIPWYASYLELMESGCWEREGGETENSINVLSFGNVDTEYICTIFTYNVFDLFSWKLGLGISTQYRYRLK